MDEIEGLSQDTVISCFEGEFRSGMLYIELQLRKSSTFEAIFNVVWQVALEEDSAQEAIKTGTSNTFEKKKEGKCKGEKESFTPLSIPKESLITIIKEKYGVQDQVP